MPWGIFSKRRKWRLLKHGDFQYGKLFNTICVDNFEKQEIDRLLYKASIKSSSIHCVKQVRYDFPSAISPDTFKNKILEIPIEETWTIYFFDEVDWAQIQLLR